MQIITPARLAALVGVLTGLSAAATSLLQVLPVHSAVSQAIVAAAGVISVVISVAKFLEGQSAWELQQAQHAHESAIYAAPQTSFESQVRDEVVKLLSNGTAASTATPVVPTP